MLIEVCANSLQSAINAQLGGADRIELCCNIENGGLTPSTATIQYCRDQIHIALFVLIRPRLGDFCYSPSEIEVMQKEIEWLKYLGVDGVVMGVLHENGRIDKQKMEELLQVAYPLEVTFHRAFDLVADPFEALNTLIELGVDRVLSSGQQATAIEGKKMIAQLKKVANNNIKIMAGGGINETNAKELVQFTEVEEIHLSGKTEIVSPHKNKLYGKLFKQNYWETSARNIYQIKQILAKR